MSENSRFKMRKSVGGRLLAVVIAAYLLMTFAVTAVQMFVKYREVKQGILSDLAMTRKSFEGGLAAALWDYEYQSVQVIAAGIVEVQDVIGVKVFGRYAGKVVGAKGMILDENGRLGRVEFPGDEAFLLSGVSTAGFFWYTFPLVFRDADGGSPVGSVTLYSNMGVVLGKVWPAYRRMLLLLLFKTAVLFLILSVSIRRLITRPLSILAVAAERDNTAPNAARVDQDRAGTDEISAVAAAWNDLSRNLAAEREKAAALTRDLERQNDALEENVKERTAKHLSAIERLTYQVEEGRWAERKFSETISRTESRRRELSSENRKLGRRLAGARQMLLAAEISRGEALYKVNHATRNMLNVLLAASDEAGHPEAGGRHAQYYRSLASEGSNLLSLVVAEENVARFVPGKFSLEALSFDPVSVVENACALMAPRLKGRGVALIVRLDPAIPSRVIGDAARFQQMYLCMIDKVSEGERRGDLLVQVAVKARPERGAGMISTFRFLPGKAEGAEESAPAVSEMYGTAEIGKIMVGRFSEMMYGQLTELSGECGETAFRFTTGLDLPEGRRWDPDERWRTAITGVNVFVIDPSENVRSAVAGMLEGWGAKTGGCAGGREGIASLCASAEKGRPYDLVIVSHRLPDMEGAELAGALEGDPALKYLSVIFMDPGEAEELPESVALRPGVRLEKPVRMTALFEAVSAALGKAAMRPSPEVTLRKETGGKASENVGAMSRWNPHHPEGTPGEVSESSGAPAERDVLPEGARGEDSEIPAG